jgi:hypothetical protein
MIAANEGTLIIAASQPPAAPGTMEVSVTAAAYIVAIALPISYLRGRPRTVGPITSKQQE